MVPTAKSTCDWIGVHGGANSNPTTPMDITIKASLGSTSVDPIVAVEVLQPTTARRKPLRESFKVPQDELEHSVMLERLVQGGLSTQEAELTIAARKTAYNKACREYKKDAGKTNKWQKKKTGKQSNTV